MQTIILGLHCGLKTEEERTMKKKILIEYLLAHFKQHSMYAIRYWFCEFLCLVNIVGQLYLMNRFVGGEFFSYGFKGNSELTHQDDPDVDASIYMIVKKIIFMLECWLENS